MRLCWTRPNSSSPPPIQLQQSHSEHSTDMQCQKCMSVYNRYAELDKDKGASLKGVTEIQSASHLWFDARELSSAKKAPCSCIISQTILLKTTFFQGSMKGLQPGKARGTRRWREVHGGEEAQYLVSPDQGRELDEYLGLNCFLAGTQAWS